MKRKNAVTASVSAATLALLFGASAAQASALSPAIGPSASFGSTLAATNNNNNNNNNNDVIIVASKPASLADLAALA